LVREVTARAGAGRVVELAAWHTWKPRRVKVSGFEPWTGGAPPKLQLLPDARHEFAQAVGEVEAGVVEVPPAPWTTNGIGLLDGAGQIALSQPIEPEADAVAFAAKLEVAVRVVDGKRQPVADAIVEQALPATESFRRGDDGTFGPAASLRWRARARTGTDGIARIAGPPMRCGSRLLACLRATAPDGTFAFIPPPA